MANEFSMMATIKCKNINAEFLNLYNEDISSKLGAFGFSDYIECYQEGGDNFLGNLGLLFTTPNDNQKFFKIYEKAWRSFVDSVNYDNNELIVYYRSADSGEEYFRALYDNFSDSIESINITISDDVDEDELEDLKYMFGEDFSISIGNKQYNFSAAEANRETIDWFEKDFCKEFGDRRPEDNGIVNRFSTELSDDNSQNEDFLIDEMFDNFKHSEFRVLHHANSFPSEDTTDTVVMSGSAKSLSTHSFDGNDSLNFDAKRKKAFIDYYNLQMLTQNNVKNQSFYVAPNGAVLRFIDMLDTERVGVLGNSRDSMLDITNVLERTEFEISYSDLTKAVYDEPEFFPCNGADDINWEMIKEQYYGLNDTVITERYRKFVDNKVSEMIKSCSLVKVPKSGAPVRRINVTGDQSYSDEILFVHKIYDTYVSLQRTASLSGDDMLVETSLFDFWENFQLITEESVCGFISDVFELVLDNEFYKSLMKHQFVERAPKEVFVSGRSCAEYTFSITNEDFALRCHELFREPKACLRISFQSFSEPAKAVGSILDLPLVLNYLNTGRDDILLEEVAEKFDTYTTYVSKILTEFTAKFDNMKKVKKIADKVNERILQIGSEYFDRPQEASKLTGMKWFG